MDYNQVTRAFLNIRDARAKLRKQYDTEDSVLAESQRRLEAIMLDHLNTSGMESVRTEAGTYYRQEQLKPAGSDWDAFYRFIRDEDAFDALERRIKTGFVQDYIEEHGEPPPGVSTHREYVVRVRKTS